ncbi:hypothetical protein AMES_6348 [Amycolatopsis mediterranei S699]|uniref:Uncharacterized protein n=2 Tax=Amycolatopsis mediterranei TaxID=33910 RepID=A0A0H3DDM1_AMYMU|nr:hypothetical protein [Amycolatopsis mediterranei]ADJ48173.1 conserved hypothetical protein [Amycolatopsis mediterranei U32]AEK45077.1 hypothetical protein RAM_33020 [Amycolatopsis mediterranei S699]AFO79884.1 hypothetical protein AMES_6348 [Amycolatopsis mediterranei S699]AGT87012.1 hypothetical protein B737_6348 [Amycolatopsis mediterranei RB]KDO10658.1 hypothetical protein DV26_12270 [Amycolatopsis mediterranei]
MDELPETTDEPLGSGQYRYIGTHAWWTAMFGGPKKRYAYLAEHVLQLWVPADPAQDWLLDRRTTGARVWLSGTEEQAAADGFGTEAHWPTGRWQAPYGNFYAGEGQPPGPVPGSWQTPNTEFLAGVPRDPRLLYDRLRRDSPERSGYHGPFTYAADLLRSGLVPSDLRAALYGALLLAPEVTFVRESADVRGEPAAAFVVEPAGRREELFVDPLTGRFLGERSTLTEPAGGIAAGTVTRSTAVRSAVAEALGAPPR